MARKKKNQAGSTGRPLSTEPPTQPAGKLKLARAGRQATLGVLAAFVGYEVIARVPAVLHTPLMSATNAIHGIVMIGAMLVVAGATTALQALW